MWHVSCLTISAFCNRKFQSYNSSIQTSLADTRVSAYSCFNPTIVRFKQLRIYLQPSKQGMFQSYDSSIQTLTQLPSTLCEDKFQSYDSSIQTEIKMLFKIARYWFQSYDSSIQTSTKNICTTIAIVSILR